MQDQRTELFALDGLSTLHYRLMIITTDKIHKFSISVPYADYASLHKNKEKGKKTRSETENVLLSSPFKDKVNFILEEFTLLHREYLINIIS